MFDLIGPWKAWAVEVQKDKKIEPVSSPQYHFGSGSKSIDQGKPIDIDKENQAVIRYIEHYRRRHGKDPKLFIVPGYSTAGVEVPVPLSDIAKFRLKSVAKRIVDYPGSLMFLTGGNVHPADTPFNEAMEMKKYVMKNHKVPEFLIAIDPNAQNTVTNLRNAGRFIKALKFKEGTIVTTLVQNIYVSFAETSGFKKRSIEMLGYEVGEITMDNLKTAVFKPNDKVLQKSNSEIDP